MSSNLYPLKFEPILKKRIWGGSKLVSDYGKKGQIAEAQIGESWELSSVEGDISVVSNGFLAGNSIQELIEVYMGDLVGEKVYEKFGIEFPLLIKLIDANEDLSVQVHPNDELARERHHAWGKSEFWHILECEGNAELVAGFHDNVSKEVFLKSLAERKLDSILRKVNVKKGDSLYCPAGMVHAIGKGILLVEIQQTSDVTYRIYDWDRRDNEGKPRELHTDLALDAIDFERKPDVISQQDVAENGSRQLINNQYFAVNHISASSPIEKSTLDSQSFTIFFCIDGGFTVNWSKNQSVQVKRGELVLIPAELTTYTLLPINETFLLEIFIP
ncbi:MAG TPA: mannose-6-phosphate isomerase [Tenuifilaceae bacterium]|nr:mannose-6-phosphate isomerase [Tenuifilaceae bacterium]